VILRRQVLVEGLRAADSTSLVVALIRAVVVIPEQVRKHSARVQAAAVAVGTAGESRLLVRVWAQAAVWQFQALGCGAHGRYSARSEVAWRVSLVRQLVGLRAVCRMAFRVRRCAYLR
jgi:hypothetical protein